MALIAIRNFTGEIPRLPAHLLPDGAAQLAVNCDFAHGSLIPLKGGTLEKDPGGSWTPGGLTIGSLYTKDGTNWWVTSQQGVAFHQSPVIDEVYNRVYFLWPVDQRFHVGIWGSSPTGAAPDTTYYAGVPAPTDAPVLALVDAVGIPGLDSPIWTFRYWYESGGVRYQEQGVTVVTVVQNKEWTFSPAALDPATPEDAGLVVEAALTDGTKQVFKLNTSTSSTIGARSNALPGGVELSASKSGVTVTVKATWGVVETRAYCYTVKNVWGEESAPSPPALISPTYLQVVQVQLTIPSFTGYAAQGVGSAGIEIYRTFGSSPDYVSVEPTFVSGTTWADNEHAPSGVGQLLRSASWEEPPINLDVAAGVHLTPNGWFVASKANTLYMSEPYRPHAWPYSITFPKDIRSICVGAQGVVVTTAEGTYLVLGSHPASANQMKLPIPVGGTTYIGMANVEGAVVSTTNDGLMHVNGSQASLEVGQKLFTRDDWRNRYGASLANLRLTYFDGKLLGTLGGVDSTGYYGFVYRIDEAGGAFSRLDVPINTVALYPSGDVLYYTNPVDGGSPGGRKVYSWGTGSPLTMTWNSKQYTFQQPEPMGVFYIRCSGPLTVHVARDGVLVKTTSVTATGYYRLPATGPGLRWEVALVGTSEVYEFVMAGTMEELKGG